jgi:hypothetical protein
LYWRSAAPEARHSRLTSVKSVIAFMTDQVLLFWPPYREHDCDCCSPDLPAQDAHERGN